MKKNGFTLVELLAVVTILSILLLLVVPKIVNQLNNSKDEVNNATKKLIYAATEKYIKDFNIDPKDTYCIPLEDLERDEYISDTITDNNSGIDLKGSKAVLLKYKDNSGYSYELMGKKECNQEMGMLSEGLVPVAYDGDNWFVVSQTNKNGQWYSYDEQKWANAVVLKNGVTKNIGDTVLVDGTEAVMMYVWIPRYEYNYKKLETELTDEEKLNPPAIEINFISKETTTPSSSDYKVHPAFDFDGAKSGMWVGKFELSSVGENLTTNNNLGCSSTVTEGCTNNISKLRILPNVSSLRYNNVSNFFYAIKGISTSFGLSNIDTHMMKNSEWGAVTYLSQSKYGKYGNTDYENKYKEVYQNKSNTYTTGSSNGTPSQADARSGGQCSYNDMTSLGEGKGQCGPAASTTGNIYGVYDMSGGSWEYVMGVYEDGIGTSNDYLEFTTMPDSKYYDIYKTSTANTACDGVCYAHALSETSGWYEDCSVMVTSNIPLFVRGGNYNDSNAGVFNFSRYGDGGSNAFSTRVVGFAK